MGWWPFSRSRIESRRKPSPTGPEKYSPTSSGPRCASASRIASTDSRAAGAPLALKTPHRPHMLRQPPHDELARLEPTAAVHEVQVGLPFGAEPAQLRELGVRVVLAAQAQVAHAARLAS